VRTRKRVARSVYCGDFARGKGVADRQIGLA